MKTNSSLFSLFVICISVLIITSCKDEDECDGILCENGGICVEGTCDCPEGFSGIHCEI